MSTKNSVLHRLARPLVRPLVSTSVRPNHITTLRLAAGIAAAAAFAVGTPQWTRIGGALYFLSLLLDHADGELARLQNTASSRGHRYDQLSDYLSLFLTFACIGYGQRNALGWVGPAIGFFAAGAVLLVFMLHARMERKLSIEQGQFPGLGAWDLDNTLLVISLGAFLDVMLPLLIGAAAGTPIFALYASIRYRVIVRA